MQFTLVSTVFNEMSRLDRTITDIEAQTLKPSEIVITDAGSTDGTYIRLMQWQTSSTIPIKLLQEKGCNVARGRNLAIEAAQHELIVSTDFGCRFHPKWLESLVEPFKIQELQIISQKEDAIQIVGGAFTIKENEIETKAAKADYILQRGYPVILDDYFSVSSRSIAYKKNVWEIIGGYPEWLTLAADDTIFWKLAKKHGFTYTFVEQPYVYWGRHKTDKAFAKEAFRYGLGDGESRINYRNFWSNLIETGMRYGWYINLACILICLLLPSLSIQCTQYILLILFSPGLRSYYNAFKNWKTVKSDKYNFSIFLHALWQLELSRQMYLKGYIRGLLDKDPQKAEGRSKLWEVLNAVEETK
jgi:glycosyltransferase involved in cell wall biosynthesis